MKKTIVTLFFTSLAGGNVALSVSLTAIATLGAVFFTPFSFALWGGWFIDIYSHSDASGLMRPLEIDALQMFQTVFIILGIPLLAGILFNNRFPVLTKKMVKPVKQLSILVFVVIVTLTFVKNFAHFLQAIEFVFLIVLLHNALAFGTGYLLGTITKRPLNDRKTIAIETGIQNSGLALVLIFNPKIFPPDMELGGMAIIAAWWGIWGLP